MIRMLPPQMKPEVPNASCQSVKGDGPVPSHLRFSIRFKLAPGAIPVPLMSKDKFLVQVCPGFAKPKVTGLPAVPIVTVPAVALAIEPLYGPGDGAVLKPTVSWACKLEAAQAVIMNTNHWNR